MKGGKYTVLVLRKVFNVSSRSFIMPAVSLLDLDDSISTRTPANSELNNCFASVASLCDTQKSNILTFHTVSTIYSSAMANKGSCWIQCAPVLGLEVGRWGCCAESEYQEDLQPCSCDTAWPEHPDGASNLLSSPVEQIIANLLIHHHNKNSSTFLYIIVIYPFVSLRLNFYIGESDALLLSVLQKSPPEPQNVCTSLPLSCMKSFTVVCVDANDQLWVWKMKEINW